jgi:carbamoyl-phosphate synthase large subunit
LTTEQLWELKQLGISDRRIADLSQQDELAVRAQRKQLGVIPAVLQIDTLGAEFPAETNYLYLTYNAHHHDIAPAQDNSVIVLGSGPYRIGSSVEFDWTSVNTVEALRGYEKQAIIINSNPETVSTDYDVSDRLYFEELTFERIADIYDFEMPYGLIVSVGGQTPNNRAQSLHHYGCHLLGTAAPNIDRAENRSTFSQLLDTLGIRQPEWNKFSTLAEVEEFAQQVGYPVLVRPSYVLSGSAMKVCDDLNELEQYVQEARALSPEHPVTISRFFEYAREVEFDAVAQHGNIKTGIVSEHIENAGVHSGDATIVLPPQNLTSEIQQRIIDIGQRIIKALEVTGPVNIQFLVKDEEVYVIETNLRASRTFPFISKVTGINMMELFVSAIFQDEIPEVSIPEIPFVAIKAPQFSFSRLMGADPVLGVEMASTGEVACFGDDLEETYLKAILATGNVIPQKGIFLSVRSEEKQAAMVESLPYLRKLGVPIYALPETYRFLQEQHVDAILISGDAETQSDSPLNALFREQKVDLSIIIVAGRLQRDYDNNYRLRRLSIDSNIQLVTKVKQARLLLRALATKNLDTLPIKAWDENQVRTSQNASEAGSPLVETHA